MDYISKNNLPVVPIYGSFKYNIEKDISVVDLNQQKIYGFDINKIKFSEVLKKVDIRFKTLFQEQSLGIIGKVDVFSTNEFQLENGNIISEILKFIYHPNDYERRTPIEILGQTLLLRKVA